MGLAPNGTTKIWWVFGIWLLRIHIVGAEFGTICKFETPEVKCDIDIRWLEMYVEYVVPSHLRLKSTILSVVRTNQSVVIVHIWCFSLWAWWACNVCWWSSTCMGRVNMEGQFQVNSAGQATVWSRDRVFTLQTKCPQAVQLANCRNLGVASPQCSAIRWNCLLNAALSKLSVGSTNDTLNEDRQVPTFHALDLMTHVSCQHLHNVIPSICTPWRCFQHVSIQPWKFPKWGDFQIIHCCCGFFMKPSSYWGYTIWFLHSWIDAPHAPKYSGEATEPKTCSIASWVFFIALHRSHWSRLRDAFRGWMCGK